MHWQRALELPILHETQSLDSSHAAELVSCWRGWPDASGTSPSDAPLELLRRDLSARPPRRERVGGGKMWGRGERKFSFCGENRIGFSGPYPPLACTCSKGARRAFNMINVPASLERVRAKGASLTHVLCIKNSQNLAITLWPSRISLEFGKSDLCRRPTARTCAHSSPSPSSAAPALFA